MALQHITEEGSTKTFIGSEKVLYAVPNTCISRYQDKNKYNLLFLVFCNNSYSKVNCKATGIIYFKGEWHHLNYISDTQEFEIEPVHIDVVEFIINLNLISSQKPEEILGV
jgi:hypothetical protein